MLILTARKYLQLARQCNHRIQKENLLARDLQPVAHYFPDGHADSRSRHKTYKPQRNNGQRIGCKSKYWRKVAGLANDNQKGESNRQYVRQVSTGKNLNL